MRTLALSLTFLMAAGAFAGSPTPAAVDHSATTPDFCQTDPEGEFPRGGRDFCGPTSASNTIIHFARTGFGDLLPAGEAPDDKGTQIRLIHRLASPELMNTTSDGTGPVALMEALKKHIEQSGYRAELEHQGWRGGRSESFPRLAAIPSPEWVRSQLARPNTAVLLNVGWYRHDESSQTYQRLSGHWITVVGYASPTVPGGLPVLLVHDPAPRTGSELRTQRVELAPISGELRPNGDPAKDRGRSAEGFHQLKGEMVVKTGADAAILDVAVAVTIDRASAAAAR